MQSPSRSSVDFEQLVADALDSLPDDIVQLMDNVDVVIEDRPTPQIAGPLASGNLLGLYHGVPLTKRGVYSNALPDIIYIFREPIERMCRTDAQVREQVRRTVIHEIAHHFGIEEDRLTELGWD